MENSQAMLSMEKLLDDNMKTNNQYKKVVATPKKHAPAQFAHSQLCVAVKAMEHALDGISKMEKENVLLTVLNPKMAEIRKSTKQMLARLKGFRKLEKQMADDENHCCASDEAMEEYSAIAESVNLEGVPAQMEAIRALTNKMKLF